MHSFYADFSAETTQELSIIIQLNSAHLFCALESNHLQEIIIMVCIVVQYKTLVNKTYIYMM